jgi:hypothetical protein
MSVNSMVDDFLRRSTMAQQVAHSALSIAPEAVATPMELEKTAKRKGPTGANGGFATAMKKIVGYIPAEVVAAYIPLLDLVREGNDLSFEWGIFWLFVVITPAAVLATYAAKLNNKRERERLKDLKRWPWWAMIAASISFVAWAAALPGSVMNELSWFRPALGAAAVVVAGLIVGLLSPVFE